ncbi:MAG: ATP synthase subunit I [Pyrinomonadaceae bacterium]
MSGISDAIADGSDAGDHPTHSRILVIMAILGVIGSVAGAMFHSLVFGIGVLVGTVLAFGNYYWLRRSLRKMFAEAVEGEKPKISALKYITRYFAIAAIIALIFVTGILPIVAVIFGLCGFAFAVVVDGIIRIFQGAEALCL